MAIPFIRNTLKRVFGSRPTIVLLNDCRDQANYGALALVDGLEAIITAAVPRARFVTIPSHWVIDAAFGFKAFWNNGSELRQPEALWPEVADQFEIVAEEWQAGRGGPGVAEYLERFKGADLVVLNGEGSLYRTNLSAIRELFLAWFAKTRLGLPTIFINGLVHLTQVTPTLPAMVDKTFSALDAVMVREPYSLRNLKEYLPHIPARVIPDSAYYLTADLQEASPAIKQMQAELAGADYFCYDPGAMPTDHRYGQRSGLQQLIKQLQSVVPNGVLVASSPFETNLEAIAAETGCRYLPHQSSYRHLMAVLAGASFQVTGRYHNPILGAIVGCPAVSLATTSHKNHGGCEILGGLIGAPYDGTDLRRQTPAIVARATEYYAERATLRPALQAKAASLRVQSMQMGQLVRSTLGQPATG